MSQRREGPPRWALWAAAAVVLLLLIAKVAWSYTRPPSPPPLPSEPARAEAAGPWGVPSLDALYAVGEGAVGEGAAGGEPALFLPGAELAASPRLGDLVVATVRAGEADLRGLPDEARVALQNDAMGLAARAEESGRSEPRLERLRRAAAHLAWRAALPPDRLAALAAEASLPAAFEAALGTAGPGFEEHGSEMPVFSHERHFRLRRVFRVAFAEGDRRALFSQLVAFDREGRARMTRVIGEIEALRFEGEALAEARVWELDRGALARGEATSLRELDAVRQVPSLGADSFFLREPAPVPLAELPCARCHDDREMMSLPDPGFALEPRWEALIAQVVPPAR